MTQPFEDITVVAGGGGAYGSFTRGALRRIRLEMLFRIKAAAGLSAGAMAVLGDAYDELTDGDGKAQRRFWEDTKETFAPLHAMERIAIATGLHKEGAENIFARVAAENLWQTATFGAHAVAMAKPNIEAMPMGKVWTSMRLFPDQHRTNPLISLLERNHPDAQRVLWQSEAPFLAASVVDAMTGETVVVTNKKPDGSPNRDFSLTNWGASGALFPMIPAVTMNLAGKTRLGMDGVYGGEFAPWHALPKDAPRKMLCIDLGPPKIAKLKPATMVHPLVEKVIGAYDLTAPQSVPKGFDIQVLRYNPGAAAKEGDSARPSQEVLQRAYDAGYKAADEWIAGGAFNAPAAVKAKYRPRMLAEHLAAA